MHAQRWEEIQASFDELVKLDAGERAGRLALLASTDPELFQALESLLTADAEASACLAPIDGAFTPPSTRRPDPLGLTGRTISHFELHEALGAGGMGVVYRARDTQLGRPVALKFLSPAYNIDAVAKARFLREAHSAAALDHPNLCTIHEVGTSEDGWLFMAMPLYDGETLKARLARNGALPVPEMLAIARQIATGLQAAHTAGIVHRDLKPGNIMLLPDGTVRILDFGLAKARDESLTETGMVVGTVSYMAPEQILGETVDQRADLWALGVVLYETLTDRIPFDGEQPIAIARAILNDQPGPLFSHRTDVPLAVEDVVLRLLDKSPAKRYASAAELLDTLARVSPTAGARDSLRRRVRRVGRALSRNRARLVAGGAAIGLIGAGAYGAVARARAATAPPPRTAIAVLPFRSLSGDTSRAYFASGLEDEIRGQLYKVPGLKVIGRSSVLAYSGSKTPPLKQVAKELGVGSLVEASVQVVANKVRVNVQLVDGVTETPLWVQQYDRALEDAFALQSEIAQQIVATVGVVLGGAERGTLARVPTEKAQAYLLYLKGKDLQRRPGAFFNRDNLEAAGRLYERAIALDPWFALAHAALAGYHAWMYILRYDMSATRLALQRLEAETALRLAPNSPEAHQAMGGVFNVGPNTNPYEANKEWKLASRLAPNDPQLMAGRAAFFRQTGNWEEYEKTFLKIVQLDPRNADFLADYGGDTHFRMGRFADAIHWHERAASITGDTLGLALTKAWVNVHWKGNLELVRDWMSGEGGRIARRERRTYPLAAYWFLMRQPDSMLAVLNEERQRVWQGAFSFEPVALWRAAAHHMRGDQRAARAELDSALALADSGVRAYRDDHSVHVARGMALAGLGRRAEALDEVQKVRANFLFKDVWVREGMLLSIANIHATLGDAEAAVGVLEELLSQKYTGVTVHMLRLYPDWDRVRKHPRFRALLAKYAAHPNLRS